MMRSERRESKTAAELTHRLERGATWLDDLYRSLQRCRSRAGKRA